MTRKQEKIEQIKKNIAAARKNLKYQEECLKAVEAAPDKFPSTEAKALIKKRNDLLEKINKGIKLGVRADLKEWNIQKKEYDIQELKKREESEQAQLERLKAKYEV